MFRYAAAAGGFGAALAGSYGWCKEAPVVVVGGGVMGAATCYSLRTKGVDCVLIDDGYPFKSSWGESRVVREVQREAIFMGLIKRAMQLWEGIEADIGEKVLLQTGVITTGGGEMLEKVKANNMLLGLGHTDLDRAQYPQVRIEGEAIFQTGGWAVLASKAVDALYTLSGRRSGVLVENDEVVHINRESKYVLTESGKKVRYSKLVLTCGPKTNKVLLEAKLSPLAVVCTAEQQNYYKPKDTSVDHSTSALPIIIEMNERFVYVVPHIAGGVEGVKVSLHASGEVLSDSEYVVPKGVDPLSVYQFGSKHATRNVVTTGLPTDTMPNVAVINKWVQQHLPHLEPEPHYTYRCVYTSSVKGDGPVMGPHPEDPDVVLCCAFGGEGFKFAPAYGEVAGNYALGARQVVEGLERFLPDRLVVAA